MRPFLFALAVTAGLGALSVPAAAAPVVGAHQAVVVQTSNASLLEEVDTIYHVVFAVARAFGCGFGCDVGGLEGVGDYLQAGGAREETKKVRYDAANFSRFDG